MLSSYPWLQLVVDKFDEYVVLDPQELRDSLCDPRLYCVHINFRHVNLVKVQGEGILYTFKS